MNDLSLITLPQSDLDDLLNWVNLGIEHYRARISVNNPEKKNDSAQSWQNGCQTMINNWPPAKGNLARCINEFDLCREETFLLILAGQIETDAHITFTIHELQQPESNGPLSVHLALEMINTLFDNEIPWSGLDLLNCTLITNNLLTLAGDDPLPLQSLRIQPSFWSVLNDRPQIWPTTVSINSSGRHLLPRKSRQSLPRLAKLLQKRQVQTLILRGQPNSGRRYLAAEIGVLLGMQPLVTGLELWRDQRSFQLACHYADWLPVINTHLNPGEVLPLPLRNPAHPVIILVNLDGAISADSCLEHQLGLPDQQQRHDLWLQALADEKLARKLSGNVLLSGPTIVQLAESAKRYAQQSDEKVAASHILLARQNHGTEKLRLLADPVLRRVSKNAIVFPPQIDNHLEDMVTRAKRREALWDGLGTTMQASRNSGLRALFVGESGTGKTLAASYLATRLGTPLYRVDLGAVMNKYIGESEKNLGQLLDQAAASDVILLFDEADSLFGSRTDAKQTGERYANNLTNYLLTRIENHPGVVILTTNSRERIDTAFHRRIEIIIDFPLPGFNERKLLWHSHLGTKSPDEEIIRSLASHCDLSGGQIRNAVLAAAGNQADKQQIDPRYLVEAIRREYQKLGRNMPSAIENLGK
ncbi:MAG: ATP-binding protein [Desulfocapsaceae bacterium]|nr:ATP-binding protein [Desulfocapsaceae bacterium]